MSIKYNLEDKTNHNSVGAIIKNEKGEFLVQYHIKYNFVTLPIGKAKLNENQKAELKREVKEETNIDIIEFDEIYRKTKLDVRDGIEVTMNIILFEVTKWTGEVENLEPKKHNYVKFMSYEELLRKTNDGKNTSWMTQLFIQNKKTSKFC